MRKELRPVHDIVACDRCGRTILKGERIETFVGSGARRQVCELCSLQALRAGWMREATLEDQTRERERLRPRRSLWSRAMEWVEEQGLRGEPPSIAEGEEQNGPAAEDRPAPAPEPRSTPASTESAPPAPADEPTGKREASSRGAPTASETGDEAGDTASTDARGERERERALERERARAGEAAAGSTRHAEDRRRFPDLDGIDDAFGGGPDEFARPAAWARRPARSPGGAAFKDLLGGRRREPREVHAVPTGRYAKIERAFELFNASEHPRTIAGVGRALGEPWVSAAPLDDGAATHEVRIVVAWELSWYRYRVDLADADQAVLLFDRGDEVDDLDEAAREWNAGADGEGRLALATESVS